MPEIFLKTIDEIEIFGDWSPQAQTNTDFTHAVADQAALFIHGRGSDHAGWEIIRKPLEEKGWSTLAIDLRGHGRSEGPPPDKRRRYDQFDDYHSMMFDVTAAADFIHSTLYPKPYTLAIVGSSIGANLALGYAADHFEARAVVALSPGIDYRGLRGDDYLYQYHRPLAIITAKDDHTYGEVQKLLKVPGLDKAKLWYQEFETGGHGRDLLRNHPDLLPQLCDWLEKQIVVK